ncbi:unnamed protein product, partial [Rotaria magnacalcarata]
MGQIRDIDLASSSGFSHNLHEMTVKEYNEIL